MVAIACSNTIYEESLQIYYIPNIHKRSLVMEYIPLRGGVCGTQCSCFLELNDCSLLVSSDVVCQSDQAVHHFQMSLSDKFTETRNF